MGTSAPGTCVLTTNNSTGQYSNRQSRSRQCGTNHFIHVLRIVQLEYRLHDMLQQLTWGEDCASLRCNLESASVSALPASPWGTARIGSGGSNGLRVLAIVESWEVSEYDHAAAPAAHRHARRWSPVALRSIRYSWHRPPQRHRHRRRQGSRLLFCHPLAWQDAP